MGGARGPGTIKICLSKVPVPLGVGSLHQLLCSDVMLKSMENLDAGCLAEIQAKRFAPHLAGGAQR